MLNMRSGARNGVGESRSGDIAPVAERREHVRRDHRELAAGSERGTCGGIACERECE